MLSNQSRVMTLREAIKESIDELPDERLLEVMNFIRFIMISPSQETMRELLEDLEDIKASEAALAEGSGKPAEDFFAELGI